MRTNTVNATTAQAENTQTTHSSGLSRVLRRGAFVLLALLGVLLALLSTLSIALMFFFTAVPIWVTAVSAVIDLAVIIGLVRWGRTTQYMAVGMVGLILITALVVFLSQQLADTPPITEDGSVIPGSIASLERVELNGSTQWMTIRGHSEDLPVLLFLAGGPGGSELVMTRRYLGELEKHFIVVNWDQPGTGKSYNAVDFDELTPERYVQDAYALTNYLRERFDEDKIYVFGESWGSIIGVWLVDQHPELFHAFISTGQMVDVVENDIQMYEFAIQRLSAQGRMEAVEGLRRNGPPPYAGRVLLTRFGAMNGVVNDYMNAHAHGEGTGHNLMFDSLAAHEYGLLDKVYWVLGLARTFTTVYPQLYDLDFRTQVTELQVPAYFIKGRWDINASNSLLEEYFAILQAPHKELIWFEDSAHTPSWDEPDHFIDVMVNTVLAQTSPHE